MQAIILANHRLKGAVDGFDNPPVCILKVMDKTILEWQIETFRLAGIESISVATAFGYLEIGAIKNILENNDELSDVRLVSRKSCRHKECLKVLVAAFNPMCRDNQVFIVDSNILFSHEIIEKMLEPGRLNRLAYDSSKYDEQSVKVVMSNRDGVGVWGLSPNTSREYSRGVLVNIYRTSRKFRRDMISNIEYSVEKYGENCPLHYIMTRTIRKPRALPLDVKDYDYSIINTLDDYKKLSGNY